MKASTTRRIGIIGGGPAALFMVKRLLETSRNDFDISIFEKGNMLGAGMPYSEQGANAEHIANVSGNEIPELLQSIQGWLNEAPAELLEQYRITSQNFNAYKVVPRLLLGAYLNAQFAKLIEQAGDAGIPVTVHFDTLVTDAVKAKQQREIKLITQQDESFPFDQVIICTGHCWPKKYEGKVPGWFDSPYPPAKLCVAANFPVAIKGASLTAIDAMRTLARRNGWFAEGKDGMLQYTLHEDAPNFRLVLHSIDGLLPAIRFHLEDSHLSKHAVLSEAEVKEGFRHGFGLFVSLLLRRIAWLQKKQVLHL